jgi:multicomponent Na+:H+ antiporter subunit C
MILVSVALVGVLYAAGTYLLLQRSLTRVVMGLGLMGHGANLLLLLAGGRAGREPIVGSGEAPMTDPLPQALALTAIVITFGVTAFLLALAYRSWQLRHSDEVENDLEDRRIARLVHRRERGAAHEDEELDDIDRAAEEERRADAGVLEP